MVLLWQFVILLAAHWFTDFVLQTRWQALNKSKNNIALMQHIATYTGVFAVASAALFGINTLLVVFVIINGALHFVIDYFTSRISSKLYIKQDWHNFFVVIGFDQLLHQTTLATTLWLIYG